MIKLTPKQTELVRATTDLALMYGGSGSGKTTALKFLVGTSVSHDIIYAIGNAHLLKDCIDEGYVSLKEDGTYENMVGIPVVFTSAEDAPVQGNTLYLIDEVHLAGADWVTGRLNRAWSQIKATMSIPEVLEKEFKEVIERGVWLSAGDTTLVKANILDNINFLTSDIGKEYLATLLELEEPTRSRQVIGNLV